MKDNFTCRGVFHSRFLVRMHDRRVCLLRDMFPLTVYVWKVLPGALYVIEVTVIIGLLACNAV